MSKYIDGFVAPIPKQHLEEYQKVASEVAKVWKEYGAIDYFEYAGDAMHHPGIRSFREAAGAAEDEVIIFGYAIFDSRETRDSANAKVPKDPRMSKLVGPLMDPERLIFDASRMIYGGFERIV